MFVTFFLIIIVLKVYNITSISWKIIFLPFWGTFLIVFLSALTLMQFMLLIIIFFIICKLF